MVGEGPVSVRLGGGSPLPAVGQASLGGGLRAGQQREGPRRASGEPGARDLHFWASWEFSGLGKWLQLSSGPTPAPCPAPFPGSALGPCRPEGALGPGGIAGLGIPLPVCPAPAPAPC